MSQIVGKISCRPTAWLINCPDGRVRDFPFGAGWWRHDVGNLAATIEKGAFGATMVIHGHIAVVCGKNDPRIRQNAGLAQGAQ